MSAAPAITTRSIPELPWWTWVVPLPVVVIAYKVSFLFIGLFGSSIIYLPITLGIVMVHWWGPRVLTPLYITAVVFSQSWNEPVTSYLEAPLVATHDTVTVFLSWLLYRKIGRGDCRLENISELVKFLVLGILLPVSVNSLYYPFLFRVYNQEWIDYWKHVGFLLLADFTTSFAVIIPLLFFLTPHMDRLGLTLRYSLVDRPSEVKHLRSVVASDAILVIALLLVLSLTVDFETYWFVYGISALYLAVRHGFEIALIGNAFVFVLIYFLPSAMGGQMANMAVLNPQLTNFNLGMCLLFVCTTVVGRVISDLRNAEKVMQSKNRILELTNEELHHTNRELDRFVYSVSHDLSAPLKSMMGLVNISKIETNPDKLRHYFDLIANRVNKLENFISEVLDFSRSNRKELKIERIELGKLLDEVLDNHKETDLYNRLHVERKLRVNYVHCDRLLLKIILNNLVTNAIFYQKKEASHQPQLVLATHDDDSHVCITITDNGEGIPQEIQHKIFTMFFRGNLNSTGSGLGLYIAKEAATRIHGKIAFRSEAGQGTEFTVKLPK